MTSWFVFWGSFGATEKVLWRFPPIVLLYICLPISCGSGANGCSFRKASLESSPLLFSRFVSQLIFVNDWKTIQWFLRILSGVAYLPREAWHRSEVVCEWHVPKSANWMPNDSPKAFANAQTAAKCCRTPMQPEKVSDSWMFPVDVFF